MPPSKTNSSSISGFDPRSVPGCVLWLDATDNSTIAPSPGIQWKDKSIFGNNATGFTGLPSLDPTGINGRQAILFNGSSSFSGAISAENTNTITVFIVGRLVTPFNQFAGILCFGNPFQLDWDNEGSLAITMNNQASSIVATRVSNSQITPIVNSIPFLYVLQYDGTTVNSFLNGTSQTPTNIANSGTFTYTNYAVANRAGNGGSAPWSGYIGEILVYQSSLSDTNRQRVEGYLAWSWGLNTSLIASQPFKLIRPFSRYLNPIDVGDCLLWFDASDTNTITVDTFNNTIVAEWRSKVGFDYATNYSGDVTTGSNYYGLNILRFDPFCALSLYAAIPNQPRAWFAVFRQTTQVALQGTGDTQYFACVNQLEGNGQDSFFGPAQPIDIETNSYVMAEGPSGVDTWVQTLTAPNGFNAMKQYCIVNSEASSAGNFITVDGAEQILTRSEYAQQYRTVTSQYTLGDRSYGNGCDIAEILLFNTEFTVAQRQQIEGYLAHKWGIAASLPVTHPFSTFPPSSALPFAPPNISQCILWLDGADPAGSGVIPANNSIITSWVDKSLSGNTCSNTSSPNSPVFTRGIVNGLSALSFTGTFATGTQWLDNTVMSFPNVTNTIFAVVYNDNSTTKSTTSNNYIISGRQDQLISYSSYFNNNFATFTGRGPGIGWNDLDTNTPSRDMNGVWSLTGMTNESTVLTPYFNGTQQNTKSGPMAATTGFIIGDAPSGFRGQCWNGFIAEIIIYSKVLNTIERQKVEGYLASKWGLQKSLPSTHPYKLFQPAQESFPIIVPGAIATVTLSGLSGSGGTINWTESTNAVGYNWFVGTGSGSGQVATGTVVGGGTLTATVTFAFIVSTNYFAWVIPFSSTGTNGPTTISAAASYSASVLITTVGAGSVSLGAGSQIVIECWGGGGGSMGNDQNNGAGAGGAYARTTISQAAAFTLFFVVGAGGTGGQGSATSGQATWARIITNAQPTDSSQGALAVGGAGSGFTGPNNSTQAANSIGQLIYIGGAGGFEGPENGGGGSASSAGNGNPGLSGLGTNGGASGPGGGAGGLGGGTSFSAQDGFSNTEGGGGGGGSFNNAGGQGGVPGGAGGMGWSSRNAVINGGTNTNFNGTGGDGGRGQIRYSRT